MRSGIWIGLIVVALGACVTAAERPELFARGDILIAAEDPNAAVPGAGQDPNKTWDPATHLAADWESIAVNMSSRIYNPTARPDAKVEGPTWSMSLTALLDVVDSNGLIGWATSPTSVLALDQNGAVVTSSTANSSMVRWYRQPRSWTMPVGFPAAASMDRVSLSLPVDPNAAYPEMFSRVEWTMNVLVAQELKTIDVPFKANDTWVELTPGMEILVEQATVQEGKYEYRIKARYDRTKVEYLMSGSISLWRDQTLPPVAVLKMDVLNADGKSIRDLGGGAFGSSGSYGGSTGTASGHGSCTACGAATTFRYTLAFNLYELEARLALQNVPVPEF